MKKHGSEETKLERKRRLLREANARFVKKHGKPCPDCGKLIGPKSKYCKVCFQIGARSHCVCYDCGYSGPLGATEATAIKSWNKLPREEK